MKKSPKPKIQTAFLHGFLGSPEDWYPILNALSWKGIKVPHLIDFKEHEGPLVGYSMGGRAALQYALENPSRVSKLILISTHPGLSSDAERHDRRIWEESWIHRLESEGLHQFLESWYNQTLFASLKAKPKVYQKMMERRRNLSEEDVLTLLKRYRTSDMPNYCSDLKEAPFPILFLYGEEDHRYHTLYQHHNFNLGHHRVEKVSHSGHALHLENPMACARLISEFLGEDL